jgi:hypothetical protein
MPSTIAANAENSPTAKSDERAGKYLTFLIGKEEFGVGVMKVRSGPIGIVFLRKHDMMLEAGETARYSHSPFMNVVGNPCFGILPLVVDGIIAGCLYFDSASDTFAFDAPKRQALLELRKFAVMPIARKRHT